MPLTITVVLSGPVLIVHLLTRPDTFLNLRLFTRPTFGVGSASASMRLALPPMAC